jgi:hypothetical protein
LADSAYRACTRVHTKLIQVLGVSFNKSSEKLESKVASVAETIYKQGKENQVGIDDLKAQMLLFNSGIQRLFDIVLKPFERQITEEELRNHLLEKVKHLTNTLTFCKFKDLIQIIAHQEISYDKIIAEIIKMKKDGLITYHGKEIFDDTEITILNN